MDALDAAQVLSEIGYLLRFNPDEKFRAQAFSSAAWAITLERPDLTLLHDAGMLSSIPGVGAGISKVLVELLETGASAYLSKLREIAGLPEPAGDSELPLAEYMGDLHSHTTWSDGKATMREMAAAAKGFGYRYLGVTDHSPRMTIVNGLGAERLLAQSKELAEVEAETGGPTLLQGIEVDILEDGALDLPDDVLSLLDVVVASPHVKLKQDPAEMTHRMLRAVSNPHVDIIGHPTGRRPGSREGGRYDIEVVFRAAAANGVALEIDCDPARMDLSPEHAKLALDLGCHFAIDADAHRPTEFAYVPMGIWMARRAGIPRERILNFKPLKELRRALA